MARPIPLQVAPRDVREEQRVRLEQAPQKHAEAVLAGYEVLQQLYDSGVLDLLRGALAARDDVIKTVVADADTPEATRALRNLLTLGSLLGRIDPQILSAVVHVIPDGLSRATAQPDQSIGHLDLFRRAGSTHSRRGFGAALHFLESFGQRLDALADEQREL
jgi:uncharacterized protein YjgD (DUF1641 family)